MADRPQGPKPDSAELKLDLNAQTKIGWTAFHLACANGHLKIVELILDNKRYYFFDLTLKNEDGDTGLEVAEDAGKTDLANLIKNKLIEFSLPRIQRQKNIQNSRDMANVMEATSSFL